MECRDRIAFVDLQGFSVNKQFVLKEISFSISSSHTNHTPSEYHYIYKPPFAWKFVSDACKRGIIWLTVFHHGFYWNDGVIPYTLIDKTIEPLRNPNLTIYVKGAQKVEWLKAILNANHIHFHNIEDIGCDIRLSSNQSCRVRCGEHKHKAKHCALQSVRLLESWYCTFVRDG